MGVYLNTQDGLLSITTYAMARSLIVSLDNLVARIGTADRLTSALHDSDIDQINTLNLHNQYLAAKQKFTESLRY